MNISLNLGRGGARAPLVPPLKSATVFEQNMSWKQIWGAKGWQKRGMDF